MDLSREAPTPTFPQRLPGKPALPAVFRAFPWRPLAEPRVGGELVGGGTQPMGQSWGFANGPWTLQSLRVAGRLRFHSRHWSRGPGQSQVSAVACTRHRHHRRPLRRASQVTREVPSSVELLTSNIACTRTLTLPPFWGQETGTENRPMSPAGKWENQGLNRAAWRSPGHPGSLGLGCWWGIFLVPIKPPVAAAPSSKETGTSDTSPGVQSFAQTFSRPEEQLPR